MSYDEMTDAQLEDLFWEQDEPLDALEIAHHIKDDNLRRRMEGEAKLWYHRDEGEGEW